MFWAEAAKYNVLPLVVSRNALPSSSGSKRPSKRPQTQQSNAQDCTPQMDPALPVSSKVALWAGRRQRFSSYRSNS
jgi:hypothetical protein